MRLPLRKRCIHKERGEISKKYEQKSAKKRARRAVRRAKWKAR